jgi:hypothetical protein
MQVSVSLLLCCNSEIATVKVFVVLITIFMTVFICLHRSSVLMIAGITTQKDVQDILCLNYDVSCGGSVATTRQHFDTAIGQLI